MPQAGRNSLRVLSSVAGLQNPDSALAWERITQPIHVFGGLTGRYQLTMNTPSARLLPPPRHQFNPSGAPPWESSLRAPRCLQTTDKQRRNLNQIVDSHLGSARPKLNNIANSEIFHCRL